MKRAGRRYIIRFNSKNAFEVESILQGDDCYEHYSEALNGLTVIWEVYCNKQTIINLCENGVLLNYE